MKKLYVVLVCVFMLNFYCKAQYFDIPDYQFRSVLMNKYPSCFNALQQLDTTCALILNEDSLVFLNNEDLRDLNGIQFFKNLRYLNCSGNGIASLQYLPVSLDTLICYGLRSTYNFPDFPWMYPQPTLHSLAGLPQGLKYLNCGFNGIATIGNLPPGLKYLDCSYQHSFLHTPSEYPIPVLGGIDNLPPALEYLFCADNMLGELPALPSSLIRLDCPRNHYHYEIHWDMQTVTVYDYPGIALLPALPAALQQLECSNNQLVSLPALPLSLKYLTAYSNQLTSVPALPDSLRTLGLGENLSFASLPLLPDSLKFLDLRNCVPLKCLPHLPELLQTLRITLTAITCLPNVGGGTSVDNPKPLCNLFNNPNGCVASPIIAGNVFYDNNSNAVQDPGELPRPNVRVQITNETYAFSNLQGYFELNGSIGNNTLTIDPPAYYNAVPAVFNYTFNSYDTVVTATIALQPNISIDSLKINITPWGSPSPGFQTGYDIRYENVGTTVLNPNIVLTFNNGILNYNYSTNAAVTNTGNELHLNLTGIPPGQNGYFTSYFTVDPAAGLGSSLVTYAAISGGTSNVSDSSYEILVGSFDPNDKQATVSLTRTEVNTGSYIDYLIRFQNTGTDTAFNIMVLDKLTTRLIPTTLQMIAASHPANITLSHDTLLFQFRNIKLPDMNINEAASHGYVRFRAKPKTNLPDDAHIINSAAIYFDFNPAIITNNATTMVNVTVVPVALRDFNIKKQNNAVQLYWSTEQELNSRLFMIERSADQEKWKLITSVPAAGYSAASKNYTATDFNPANGVNYYRLKQIDSDGKFSYSEIRSVYFGNDVNIVLAPNPASDKVVVYVPGNTTTVSINICNMNGQPVKQLLSKDEAVEINLAGLPKGVYALKIKSKYVSQVKKLVIE